MRHRSVWKDEARRVGALLPEPTPEPRQRSLLDALAQTACPRCGRPWVGVVEDGFLDLRTLAGLSLEAFNAALLCWGGKCGG